VQGDDGEDGVGDDTLGGGGVLLGQLSGVVQPACWCVCVCVVHGA
jgi:hypothetical protein